MVLSSWQLYFRPRRITIIAHDTQHVEGSADLVGRIEFTQGSKALTLSEKRGDVVVHSKIDISGRICQQGCNPDSYQIHVHVLYM